MKDLIIRGLSIVLIVGILFAYNGITGQHIEADETARLAAESQNAEIEAQNQAILAQLNDTESQAETGAYLDGTYTASADGFGGPIEVAVTIENGKITAVEIESAPKEDSAFLSTASAITDDIVEAQSADVDTISGATFSSTGIREAARAALEQAKK